MVFNKGCCFSAGNLHTAGVLAGKTIVEFVRALTSLRIAGGQLAASGANSALQGLVGNIRWEHNCTAVTCDHQLCFLGPGRAPFQGAQPCFRRA